ncbi:MAG: LysM peptidoglycan-binding domain-containing protein [Sedimentisphaerales bacterium]|nr:LysM peptidoglycan-binding domain-containing protein [Sedimentisphaerales bacterium]
MTSDAKMGLLLGLVIVVVIAFLINGLPGLFNKSEEEPVKTSIVSYSANDAGLSDKAKQAVNAISIIDEEPSLAYVEPPYAEPIVQEIRSQSREIRSPGREIRFSAPLPVTSTVALSDSLFEPAAEPMLKTPVEEPTSIAQLPKTTTYTVQAGDSLGSISKKVYGEQLGNKLSSVNAIYKANTMVIDSPDNIRVGQELTIPSLSAPGSITPVEQSSEQPQAFKKVRSFADSNLDSLKKALNHSMKVYIVQEGDSLWKIAEKQLGSGERYNEIIQANRDIISDKESISVGLRLKIPAK